MEYQIVSEVGSDASYDLIVEGIQPRPQETVIFDFMTKMRNPRLEAMMEEVREYLKKMPMPLDLGLRIRLAQRIPDPFVWQARIDAALSEAHMKENNYFSTANVGKTFFMNEL